MNLKTIFLFVICCMTKIGLSYNKENVNVDSLLKILKTEKIDSNKAKIYLNISESYLGYNDSKAIHYAKLGQKYSIKSSYKNGQAKSYFCFALANVYSSKNFDAINNFKKAYLIYNEIKNYNQVAGILNNMGILYENESNYTKAIEYYFKAYEIDKKLNGSYNLALVHTNIAAVYTLQKKFDLALKHYQEAIKHNKEIENDFELSSTFKSFSEMHFDKYKYTLLDKNLNFQLSKQYLDSALITSITIFRTSYCEFSLLKQNVFMNTFF